MQISNCRTQNWKPRVSIVALCKMSLRKYNDDITRVMASPVWTTSSVGCLQHGKDYRFPHELPVLFQTLQTSFCRPEASLWAIHQCSIFTALFQLLFGIDARIIKKVTATLAMHHMHVALKSLLRLARTTVSFAFHAPGIDDQRYLADFRYRDCCLWSSIRLLQGFPRSLCKHATRYCPLLAVDAIADSTFRRSSLKTRSVSKPSGKPQTILVISYSPEIFRVVADPWWLLPLLVNLSQTTFVLILPGFIYSV